MVFVVKGIIVIFRKDKTILTLINLKCYFSHLEKSTLNLSLPSPSLSDKTFSRCPVFLDALKPEPLPVEPSGVPGHRTTKAKTHPASSGTAKGHGHKH